MNVQQFYSLLNEIRLRSQRVASVGTNMASIGLSVGDELKCEAEAIRECIYQLEDWISKTVDERAKQADESSTALLKACLVVANSKTKPKKKNHTKPIQG